MGAPDEARLKAYREDGYFVVEDLVSGRELDTLRSRIAEYVSGERSADDLQVQIEPRVQRGELSVRQPGEAIRKIDGLVEHDDHFRRLAHSPRIVGVVTSVLGSRIRLFRNSLMLKPPEVGSQKGWHQDSPYWPIEPMALCSCWLALDDATLDNGCMVVAPGCHREPALPHIPVQDDYVITDGRLDTSRAVPLPMTAGSGLFFHSLLPHYTASNLSSTWRRAYVLSYMSAASRYTGAGASPAYLEITG